MLKSTPTEKKRDEYFDSNKEKFKTEQSNIPFETEKTKTKSWKIVSEPFCFTLVQSAFLFIVLSLIAFGASIFSTNQYWTSLFYILFIDFIVASLSIFSIQLYRDKEYKRKRKETEEIIMNKIRQYFIGDIQILYDSTNPLIIAGSDRHIILEYKGKKYNVFTKLYNPDNYFLLNEKEN